MSMRRSKATVLQSPVWWLIVAISAPAMHCLRDHAGFGTQDGRRRHGQEGDAAT
jgi:hypothetical protein